MSGSGVWVISGPSGVGKGTVCARLRAEHPEAFYSVSMTTRAPRATEVDGVHYRFVDVDEFQRLIEAGELLEWAVVHGTNFYGTPKAPVEEALAAGRVVVLEIDLQGARQVKRNLPEARLVFLEPPSWDELVDRLRGRGTEDDETQRRRLDTARLELEAAAEADHRIVNGEIEETVAALVSLLGLASDPFIEG
ncbi:MAG: guanylate kinase [Arachnia sp.]